MNPTLQLAQISAPSVEQAAPCAGDPPEQVQLLAEQASLLNVNPPSQLAQIAALFEVHASPVAAIPSTHVQLFATQPLPWR